MVPKMESTYLVTYTYLEQNSYHNILISYGMTQRCRMNLPKNLLPAAKKPTRSGLQCVAKTDQKEQIKGWSGIPFDGCQTLPAKSRQKLPLRIAFLTLSLSIRKMLLTVPCMQIT